MANADGRRSLAAQIDAENEPQLHDDVEFWFNLDSDKRSLQAEILSITKLKPSSLLDRESQQRQLTKLKNEMQRLRLIEKRPDISRFLAYPIHDIPMPDGLIPFAIACQELKERLDAKVYEIAAWMVFGVTPLPGYIKTQDVTQCSRLVLPRVLNSFDAGEVLVASWFKQVDVDNFIPDERYISGVELVERWNPHLNGYATAFIVAKVAESRLDDLHPITGLTQATFPGEGLLPPISGAIFRLSQILLIESAELSLAGLATAGELSTLQAEIKIRSQWGKAAAMARHQAPGGSHDMKSEMEKAWMSGNYLSRNQCATENHKRLGIEQKTARNYLINTPKPQTPIN
jgi:hypothetical protein